MQTLTKRRHLQATCNGFRLSATLAENPGLTSDKVRATGTPNLLPRYVLPTKHERLDRFISCLGMGSRHSPSVWNALSPASAPLPTLWLRAKRHQATRLKESHGLHYQSEHQGEPEADERACRCCPVDHQSLELNPKLDAMHPDLGRRRAPELAERSPHCSKKIVQRQNRSPVRCLTVSSTWTLKRPIASDTPYGRQLTSSLGPV